MEYKDFDEFKTNVPNILGYKEFGSYELDEDYECDNDIFRIYPDHTFVIVTKSGTCYVYSRNNNRERYASIKEMSKEVDIQVKRYSILRTSVGKQIKNQYEKKSGVHVSDVIQYKDTDIFSKKKRVEWKPLMNDSE